MQEFDSQRKSEVSPPALPHNLEAEQSLLGALLFDNRLFERLPALTPPMFFDPVHGRIFNAIATIVRAGGNADAVTLKARFADDPGMKELNGTRYLVQLMKFAAPLNTQALSYAELIRDLYQRREVFDLCQRTAAAALLVDAQAQDIAEVIREGERGLSSLMAGGKAFVTAREAGAEVVEGLRNPRPSGLRSGLAKVDRLLGGGLFAPDLIILAGRPAMGKTALADNLCANVAHADKVVGFFSMEMDPNQVAARIMSRRSSSTRDHFSYSSLRSPDARPAAAMVERFAKTLPETLLIDPTGAQTLAGIEASARAMRRHAGKLDLIVVDYLQLMRDAGARRDGRVQEVSEITAGLKALAKRLGVPVVALSQLSRAVENRADKRPQLADLRESGSIEQDADIVLFVYREHYYLERLNLEPFDGEERIAFDKRRDAHDTRLAETANEFELIVGKNRHSGGGAEKLWCDLAMDAIADEDPLRTPHGSRWEQDGVS